MTESKFKVVDRYSFTNEEGKTMPKNITLCEINGKPVIKIGSYERGPDGKGIWNNITLWNTHQFDQLSHGYKEVRKKVQ